MLPIGIDNPDYPFGYNLADVRLPKKLAAVYLHSTDTVVKYRADLF